MIRRLVAVGALAVAAQAGAQTLSLEDLQRLPEGSQRELQDITTETLDRIEHGDKALVRGLDKLTGVVTDMELSVGQTTRLGHIDVMLGDCRYPVDNPSSDAYAYLVVQDVGASEPAFSGWMIASSPALNALDHARYDVWVLRCATS